MDREEQRLDEDLKTTGLLSWQEWFWVGREYLLELGAGIKQQLGRGEEDKRGRCVGPTGDMCRGGKKAANRCSVATIGMSRALDLEERREW